ncbi:hypothetical protein FACS1894110_00040 [Spirochaetia bacterium]|nr:hypothetical protein FACS1894110_00040 [Spirochaetia bacterium]
MTKSFVYMEYTDQIKPQLERRWSPEEIAKWLEADYPEHTVFVVDYLHNFCGFRDSKK